MKAAPLLSIDGYSLSYASEQGPLRILDGIDLNIHRNEVLGLVGESGSGKSSLAYAIMRGLPGRVIEQRGAIRFDGTDLLGAREARLQQIRGNRIAMVFQNAATALNPTQNLGEHVIEVLQRHRAMAAAEARARALELFTRVGLADAEALLDRYAHEVSGGEKQRVVLATAFACDPDLILFDEPTSALDATTAAALLDLFRELQADTGVAALFISHDLGVISAIAHRVAVIYAGQIVEQSRTDRLFLDPQHGYTRLLLDSMPKPAQTIHHRPERTDPPFPLLQADTISVRFGRRPFLGSLFGRGHSRGRVYAVNGVNLRLQRGETLGLVGESGCGKSSLARALVGLTPYTGEVVIDGESVLDRKKIQIIFQNPDSSLNPRHRVAQLLERPLVLYRQDLPERSSRRAEIARLLERVQLPAEFATRYPHELSGGEKQRVAIARAVAADPAVIVCDEITSGLDVSVQAAIVKLLRAIQRDSQVALLFITHDLNLLASIAHRVAVMYLGEIVEQRPVAGLGTPAYHPYTEALLSSVPAVDPAVEVRRVRLTGALPTRTAQTQGCAFASRCPRRIDQRCERERPPRRVLQADHWILCQLSETALRSLPPIRQPATRQEETQ